MDLLGAQAWSDYKALMRDAHDTFAQKDMIWKRLKSTLDRYGEDSDDNGYDIITLKVLINYNYMRSWPITFQTETGGLDRQSVQILINKDYLRELGYINGNGFFEYDPVLDVFIIDGLKHVPFGDTPASQIQDDDVFITLILKRDESPTQYKR
jgi:hypothetical protein